MRVFASFDELSKSIQVHVEAILLRHQKEIEDFREEVRTEAIRQLSGRYSPTSTKKYPWAKRHGISLLPLLPVGSRTGRLRRSLRVSREHYGFGVQVNANHAKFALRRGGTRYTFDRRYWDHMRQFIHRRALEKFSDTSKYHPYS